MKKAIALRHVHFEGVGAFELPLREANYQLVYHDVGVDDLSSLASEKIDLLIVLGAPIGAYEIDAYPFLEEELGLLRKRLAEQRPTLGICLGAQLMALALGAEVRPGTQEIGWAPVEVSEAGQRGPLSALGDSPMLHWHGDGFALPDGADRLASTEACANQAFALGPNLLGLQFHAEADPRSFERWLIGHAAEISAADLSVNTLRSDAARYAERAAACGQKMIVTWLSGLSEASR